MVEGSTIQARFGAKVVSIKTCWPQSKTDRLKVLYPPNGVVDIEHFIGSDSSEVERLWLKTQVLRALGLLKEPTAHFDQLLP